MCRPPRGNEAATSSTDETIEILEQLVASLEQDKEKKNREH